MSMEDTKKSKFTFGGFFRKKIPSISITKTEYKKEKEKEKEVDESESQAKVVEPVLDHREHCVRAGGPSTINQVPSSILDDSNHITVIHSNGSMNFTEHNRREDEQEKAQKQVLVQHSHSHNNNNNTINVINNHSIHMHKPDGNLRVPHIQDHEQERYTSFTADCISLQNSDMTSHMDEDSQHGGSHLNYSPIGKRLLEDETPPPKLSLRSILKNRSEILRMIPSVKPDEIPNIELYHEDGEDGDHEDEEEEEEEEEEEDDDDDDDHDDHDNDIYNPVSLEGSDEESEISASAGSRNPRLSDNYDATSITSDPVDITAYLSESESDFDFDPLQEENITDYKKGGYHRVVKGQIYYSKEFPFREYIILRKLGWGHFSTVWLAKSVFNLRRASKNGFNMEISNPNLEEYYVAIKFVKSNKHYIEAAEDEISLLKTINQPLLHGDHLRQQQKEYFTNFHINNNHEPVGHPGFKHVMKLLDNFEIMGPNGTHICMVFEVLGENVFNLMCKYKNFYNNINKEFKLKKETQKGNGFSFDTFQAFTFGKKQPTFASASNLATTSTTSAPGGVGDLGTPNTTTNGNGSEAGSSTSATRSGSFGAAVATTQGSGTSGSIFGGPSFTSNSSKKSTISKLSLGLINGSGYNSSNTSHDDSHPHSPVSSIEDHSSSAASAYNHEFFVSRSKTIQIIDEKIHSLDMKSLNNLIEQLRTYGGLPILLVKQIFKQVFLAIDYIHHCGVIHTDLKPENILIEIKDIMRLIKMIENDKIAKHNERKRSNSSNASSMSTVQLESPLLSPHSRKGSSVSSSFPHSRKTSTVSNSSFASIGYSRSRITRKFSNSINSHTSESPIRSSKPLPSSITTDIMFKNISYKYDSPKSVSGSGDFAVHSPTEMSHSVKSNLSLDGNSKEDNMISVKIADLGNGTFANTHFTDQIQTRQYRSPEIILGYKKWGALTDLWSIGCMIFELITGDYLFEPHDGKHYDRDDDHMAQIVELLGGFPTKEYLNQCRFAKDFFKFDPSQPSNADVKFRKIPQLKYWPLKNVLIEKYHFSKDDPNVALISDLISKCLRYDPRERIDAGSLSNHPWFNNCGNFDHLEKINGHLELETKGVDIPGYSSPYSVDDEKSEISVSQVSDSTEGVIGVAEIHVDETPIGNLS